MKNLIDTNARTNPACAAAQEYMQLKRKYETRRPLTREDLLICLQDMIKIVDYEPAGFPSTF